MSEDIHKWIEGRYTLMFDEHTFFVWDNVKDKRMTALNVTKKLNEQQSTINKLKEELKLEQDFASRWQKESGMLAKENEQLHHELQQIKEYLQTKIDECKNHKKMKEFVFGVEQAVGYEKALLQFQKGLKRRLKDE